MHLDENNVSTGGGYIVHHDEQRFIRGTALLTRRGVDRTGRRAIGRRTAAPVLIRDLGQVKIAAMTRQGAVTRDGRGEVVTGMVIMLLGENSRDGRANPPRRESRRSKRHFRRACTSN